MSLDLLIVGGGPAGLASAIYARMAGLSACVLERRTAPLDKACGEGLMPHGVAALAEMRIELAGGDYAHLAGVRFVDSSCSAETAFATGAGRGIRRTILSAALRQRARELGVELRDGCEVTAATDDGAGVTVETKAGGPQRARFLVAADGLHSRLRQRLGLARRSRGAPRYGVRRHFALPPWTSFVEVHWGDAAEAYVTPVGPNEVGVAFLWSGGKCRFDELMPRFPRLAERLAGVPASSEPRGGGPFAQPVARRYAGRIALVGDAAGYLDPLSGEGVTLGFKSARALVDVIAKGRPLDDYEAAYRALSRPYYVMTRMLLWLATRPRLRARVIRGLAARPPAFSRLLAITSGEAPLAELAPAALPLAWPVLAGT